MTELALHPGLVLIVGALLVPWLRGRCARGADRRRCRSSRSALVWQVPDGARRQIRFLGYDLTPLQGDKLSRLFATIFALMAFGGGLFALGQKSRVEVPPPSSMPAAAIGVAFAGDLVTLFVFWELMAVGSTLVVWSGGAAAPTARACAT